MSEGHYELSQIVDKKIVTKLVEINEFLFTSLQKVDKLAYWAGTLIGVLDVNARIPNSSAFCKIEHDSTFYLRQGVPYYLSGGFHASSSQAGGGSGPYNVGATKSLTAACDILEKEKIYKGNKKISQALEQTRNFAAMLEKAITGGIKAKEKERIEAKTLAQRIENQRAIQASSKAARHVLG